MYQEYSDVGYGPGSRPGLAKKKVYGIFSGGGVKAAAFVGALQEASEHVSFAGVGGTSAGSIVAALIACGYDNDRITDILFGMPYKRILGVKRFRFGFNPRKGICDSAPLLSWLRDSIAGAVRVRGHRTVTFRMLAEKEGSLPLKVVATNLTNRDIKVYSARTTPDEEVAHAVLASCSFPIIFPAISHGESLIVDGGIMSNFPMWLFDAERAESHETVSSLGFTLIEDQPEGPVDGIVPEYLYSIFDSILVAQDRVQECYLDVGRRADVVRIFIPKTKTFGTGQTRSDKEALVSAGQRAAQNYFKNAPALCQERINVGSDVDMENVERLIANGNVNEALSAIAKRHILRGGVALDGGVSRDRVYVQYYVDLMSASTQPKKVEALATILASGMREPFDRVVGIQKGNVLLAANVARIVQKPLALLKADMSFKMGMPVDGEIMEGDRVVLVDDVASDASMLVHAIRTLGLLRVQVLTVMTLIERPEGKARDDIVRNNSRLVSVCKVFDRDIHKLLTENCPFPYQEAHGLRRG